MGGVENLAGASGLPGRASTVLEPVVYVGMHVTKSFVLIAHFY